MNQDLQSLDKRITTLEQESFGPNPTTHPLTVANFNYQVGLLGTSSSSVTGRSHAPATTSIPINQAGTPQLLDFGTNDFANGITWNTPSTEFICETAGIYLVMCTVSYNAVDMQDGVSYSAIVKQNSTIVSQSDVSAGGISNALSVTTSDLVSLSVGDTITYYCMTESNSGMTINGGSGAITKQ